MMQTTAQPRIAAAVGVSEVSPSAPALDVAADFPALAQQVHGKRLVYLDSAATALKPQAVIDAVSQVYARDCANVHRGVHTLSQRATDAFEAARGKAQRFLKASRPEEIVFVRGATEGINLVAQSFVRPRLQPGDEIVITALEHHANIVPWQMLCEVSGARLVVVPLTADADIEPEAFAAALGERTRFVAITQVANAFGTVLPVQAMTELARQRGIAVLIDGSQAVPHLPVDVQQLGCDFYVFSGHKLYGPTGIGVLFGRADLLAAMPPYQGGGDMIRSVSFSKTEYNDPPYRFEAGTPHIAGAVGLGAAIDYVEGIGMARLRQHEAQLRLYAETQLGRIDGLRLVGTAPDKVAVISFIVEGVHPQDLGTLVDLEGVAVRTGYHCAQPAIEALGLQGTARASLGMYNSRADIDALVGALRKAIEVLQ